jgi:hypothetical protein
MAFIFYLTEEAPRGQERGFRIILYEFDENT